jgi:hypothetical protein
MLVGERREGRGRGREDLRRHLANIWRGYEDKEYRERLRAG